MTCCGEIRLSVVSGRGGDRPIRTTGAGPPAGGSWTLSTDIFQPRSRLPVHRTQKNLLNLT